VKLLEPPPTEAPGTPNSILISEIESEDSGGEVLPHTRKNIKRNIHRVIFGEWQIKTWYIWSRVLHASACTHLSKRYFSPYPIGLDESKADAASRTSMMVSQRGQGLGLDLPGETSGSRFSRPHSRMTDLLSGASVPPPEAKDEDDVTLWVCDKCFKYMTTGASWELHVVSICYTPKKIS
jgi:hypothetical protein